MLGLNDLGGVVRSRYLVSLQYPEFRKLWGATVCSQSAAWALIIARAALVLNLTDRPEWTGYVTFAAMIPSVLMAPVAGFLADRFDRKTVLAWAYSINLGHNLVLAGLVASGHAEAWHVLLLAILNGSARSAQMPPAQALLPNMVPRERVLNAVSLYAATQHGSRFVGPFLILVVLWITGHQDWVFFVSAGLYALGLMQIVRIRTESTGLVEKGSGLGTIYRNMGAGLAYMYRTPFVLSIVLLVVAHCAMTMSFESLFPVLSREKLGMDGDAGIMRGAGYLMSGYGAAALVTALVLAGVRSDRTRGRLLMWLGVLSGIAPLGLALSPNLPLAVLATAGMGFAQGGFMTLSHATLQTVVPDGIRGRMMGVYSWHIQGFMASFNLVNANLVGFTAFTAPLVLGAGGIGFIVVMFASLGRTPLRHFYSDGVPEEARAEVEARPA